MNIYRSIVTSILLITISPMTVEAAIDKKGSADHPLIGRFEGSWIAGYEMKDFDALNYISGKVNSARENTTTHEGKVTKIAYHVPGNISVLQLYRNFSQKLKQAGFSIEFECINSDGCGDRFKSTHPTFNIPWMWGGSYYRYAAAKLSRPKKGDIYVSLYCEAIGGSGKNGCQVSIVELKSMKYKMVDASKMAKSLSETGSIALYGIYFDTNKANIKSGSKPTLDEIAKLLKKNTKLNLVVVGHTDNQGAFDYNMKLSGKRAKAVKNALRKNYGIKSKRLRAWGAGFISPVASNRNEEGRALNRRVVLVEE